MNILFSSEIIELAKEAGFVYEDYGYGLGYAFVEHTSSHEITKELFKFARLIEEKIQNTVNISPISHKKP